MVRAAFYDDKGVKRGAWSKEEDEKLRDYILRYGHWNWRELPKFAGLSRCGKSCRLRWMNYLRPDLKHGNFTKEEDDLILHLRQQLGTKWSAIASNMTGRTDNEIKNYWHAHLKKRVGWENECRSSSSRPQHDGEADDMEAEGTTSSLANMTVISPPILESSPLSPEAGFARGESEQVAGVGSREADYRDGSFYGRSETIEIERGINSDNYHNCYDTVNGGGGDFWSQPFLVDDSTIYGGDSSYDGDQPCLSWVGGDEDDDLSLMYRVMQELPDTTTSCFL